MKLKRVTFYFIDRDNVDNEEVLSLLQDYRFPNRCISPEQITVEETDIGEWSDEHRCNCPDYDLSREFNERGWIPVENGLPEERQEVLVTIKMDDSYGLGTKIVYEVDVATFCKNSGYIDSACGNGFFDTDNDWDEGQPICVIAWMPKPIAYSDLPEPRIAEASQSNSVSAKDHMSFLSSEKLLNPHGEYVIKFAENHGISIEEAHAHPTVKAHLEVYNYIKDDVEKELYKSLYSGLGLRFGD